MSRFWGSTQCLRFQILFSLRSRYYHQWLSAITILEERVLKMEIGCPTSMTSLDPLCTILMPQNTFHVKRPKLSENKKQSHEPQFEYWSDPCSSRTTRVQDLFGALAFNSYQQMLFIELHYTYLKICFLHSSFLLFRELLNHVTLDK